MQTKLIFLVSDGKTVSTTFEQPKGVQVSTTHWKERFKSEIGQAVSTNTDDPWKGTLGVYYTSSPKHIASLAKDMREHSLSLAERRIENEIHRLFGEKTSSEVRGYMWVFDTEKQRNHKWSPLGKLLWGVSQIMKGICFQGK